MSKETKLQKIMEYTQVVNKDNKNSKSPFTRKRTTADISPSTSTPKVKCPNMESEKT